MNKLLMFLLQSMIMITFIFGKDESEPVTEGQKAIDFTLHDQDGVERRLSDYKGQIIVLYFFPKAHTPG